MKMTEIAHASGLVLALRRKADLIEGQAADADASKDGRSRMAYRLREQAQALREQADQLAQIVAAEIVGG